MIRYTAPIISILGVLSAVSGFVKNTAGREKHAEDGELEQISFLLASLDRITALIGSIERVLFQDHFPSKEDSEDEEMRPISTVWMIQELRSEMQGLHQGLSDIYPTVNEELVEDSRIFETRLNSMHSEAAEDYIPKTIELLDECKVYLRRCETELLASAAK